MEYNWKPNEITRLVVGRMLVNPELWKRSGKSRSIGRFEQGAFTSFDGGDISVLQYFWSDGACVISYPGGHYRATGTAEKQFIRRGLDAVHDYWDERDRIDKDAKNNAVVRALKNPA